MGPSLMIRWLLHHGLERKCECIHISLLGFLEFEYRIYEA